MEQIRAEHFESEIRELTAGRQSERESERRQEDLVRLAHLKAKVARAQIEFEKNLNELQDTLPVFATPQLTYPFDDMTRPPVQPKPREQISGKRDS
jgi:hypothetical protein